MAYSASVDCVLRKVDGDQLSSDAFRQIIADIQDDKLSSPQIAMFLTACAAHPLSNEEICFLTDAMLNAGPSLDWGHVPVVDKHCIGGLPGNRTTPIVVAVIAALGLTIPKTSSRAITSASGTADTMEVLAPVDLNLKQMRSVIEKENGCIVWGGAVGLSPVDDDIVRVAREIGIDAKGQLVASILSKKLAAGASHLIVDIPVGVTAKVRSIHDAKSLEKIMTSTGESYGLTILTAITNGSQPVGCGIGPALEARDVIAVLQNQDHAPVDLRDKAMSLAGMILEMAGSAPKHDGRSMAFKCLTSGNAWTKFQDICEAQGGLRDIPNARYSETLEAVRTDVIESVDNARLSWIARMAGAPEDKTAGIDINVKIGSEIAVGEPLLTLYSNSPERLDLAWTYLRKTPPFKFKHQRESARASICE